MRRVVANHWLLFATAVGLLAIAGITVASVRARANGCIFDDGAAYCRMATGKLATLPWGRRVFVPDVVSWLPGEWSLVFRFKLVALVATAGATIGTGLLTLRLVRDRANPEVAYPAAVAAAALVALAPHMIRLALTTPVLFDQAAIFVGVVWCLLVTARARWLRWMSPLVVLIMVPTRESWVLPLLLATGVLWWTRQRRLAAGTLLATLAATIFTFTRPTSTAGPWGHFNPVLKVLHDGRVALTHPHEAVWAVFFGMGFAAFTAVLLIFSWSRLDAWRGLRRWQALGARDVLRGPAGIIIVVFCAQLFQVPLSGTDSRYAAAPLPYAIALAIMAAVEVRTRRAFWALVALTGATVVLWQPFKVPGRGVAAYVSMYYPGPAAALIALGGLVLIAATLVWVLRGVEATPGQPLEQPRSLLPHAASDA